MSDKVYVYSVGMTKFGKFLDKSIKSLTAEALKAIQNDDDFDLGNIEAAWFSNTGWGMTDFQHSIRGQVALTPNGVDKVSITNVENACASGSTAFNGAWTAIKAGVVDCTLAIGTEKVYQEDRAKMMGGFATYTDVEMTRAMMEQMKKAAEKKRAEQTKDQKDGEKKGKKGGHSVFMDFYAAGARGHMKKYGTTQRQLAAIAAKNHNNSTLNPYAQYTFPMTVDQVMEDYEVAYPLTRAMCAPVGDGSAAAILCSEKFLKEHPNDKAVLVRASILRSGSWQKDNVSQRASAAAYEMAGLNPKDINVAEVHDATAYGELEQIEQMGFCPLGKGGPFTESGETELGGKIAVNPSGGLISRGHPLGASGLAQIYELVTQLRGDAGKRQVNNPKFALAENGGGTIGSGPAAMCVHIFEGI
ncbi:MAG: Beta-ketoadipyl-CoA thiolase [Candidatus Lokiarchaeum sp. GC14_75]|nr:MAG: Beta-ketoadipyl-CoA thiolase [Candidatus Lokiarchaeum sp. GC14_75]